MLKLRCGPTSSAASKGTFEKTLTLSLIVALGIAAGLTVLYATAWAPWAGSDSVEYLEAARNLAGGRGLVTIRASGNVVPLYARPPLYSLVLAAMIRQGLDPVGGVRLLNAVGLATLIGLVGFSIRRATAHLLLPVMAAVFVLADVGVLDSFSGLMSEPLFLLLVVGQLVSLEVYLSGGKPWILWLSAILAALALLTRFAGAACIVVMAVAVVGWGKGPLRKRVGLAIASSFLATLPFLLWTGSLLSQGHTPGVYRLDLATARQSFGSAQISLLDTLWGWFPWLAPLAGIAYRAKLAVTAILLGLGLVSLGWVARRRAADRGRNGRAALLLGGLFAGFSLAHAAVVSAAYVFVRFPRPALDERVLLPSYVTMVLGLALLGWYLLAPLARQIPASVFVLLLLAPIVVSSLQPAQAWLTAMHADGRGYTGRGWNGLEILAVLNRLPPAAPLVSNDIDAVTFFAERPAFRLPDLEERIAEAEWRPFGQTRHSLAEREFADDGGYLVLFSSALGQLADIYGSRAGARLDSLVAGLKIVYEGNDGRIYSRQDAP